MSLVVSMLYGPSDRLDLQIGGDGAVAFTVGGNTSPLFPVPELGTYAFDGGAEARQLINSARDALVGDADNASRLSGSAYSYAALDAEPRVSPRFYALYSPPTRWSAVQVALLRLINGPWRAGRQRTLSASALWREPVVGWGGRPELLVTLVNTGCERVTAACPTDARSWRLDLLPSRQPGEDADPISRNVPSELLTFDVGHAVPSAAPLRLDPGESRVVSVAFDVALNAGRYDIELVFHAGARFDANTTVNMEGSLLMRLGQLTASVAK